MKKTWRGWTRKEEERLTALRGEGWTAARIAAELGRTVASVKCRVGRLGARLYRPRRSAWLHVLTLGLTEREAAARMGVTRWAVKRAKQRLRRTAGED